MNAEAVQGSEPLFCFVSMPFTGEFRDIRAAAVQSAINAAGCIEITLDIIPGDIPVTEGIQQAIRDADIIIADISSSNPNVIFEIGIAKAYSKDLILITQDKDQPPFALTGILVFKYGYNPDGVYQLRQKLTRSLLQFRTRGRDSKIDVAFQRESQTRLVSNLQDETDRLTNLLMVRERELEELRTARPGLDELLAIQESLKADMAAFLEEKSSKLHQDLAETQIELTRIKSENELLRNTQEQLGDLRSKMLVTPHWSIHDLKVERDLVFVLMPFNEPWSDDVWSLLQQIVENECEFQCRRADMETGRVVMHDIWEGICKARFIIADLTGGNANVAYEVGLADVLGKDVLPLSQDARAVPFDFLGLRLITYDNTIAGSRALSQKLRDRICP